MLEKTEKINETTRPFIKAYLKHIPKGKRDKFKTDVHALYSVVLKEVLDTMSGLSQILESNKE